ncbi:MAG: substrate-binding domain-containing protein [Chloroflexota bacterium]
MKRRIPSILAVGALFTVLAGTSLPQVQARNVAAGRGPNPIQALKTKLKGHVFSKGPHGERAVLGTKIKLSQADLKKIRAKHATAAISIHIGGDDWSTAQENGLKFELKKEGIRLVGLTEANGNATTQASNIETLSARRPTFLFSIPIDAIALASSYRRALSRHVKIVFMDVPAKGFVAGKDYVSDVSADNCGNGIASAYLLANVVHKQGDVGAIYYAADFFVTNERYRCFKATIEHNFPDIHIVESQGVAAPDFAGNAERATTGIIAKHPNLAAIWSVFDIPAEGVEAALRGAGRTNIPIITEDLGLNAAVSIASNGMIKALGAQRPFDQGVTEAKLAGYNLLGRKAPPYVVLPALVVRRSNVLKAWTEVYHTPPPAQLKKAYNSVH